MALGNNFTVVNFKWTIAGPEDVMKAAKQWVTDSCDVYNIINNFIKRRYSL